MHGLALALIFAAILAGKPAEVERLASEVIELSMRQSFALLLASGVILRGWARSVLGKTSEGISCIEDGIRDYRATGAILGMPYNLALKAEALHLANRTPEALEAIKEAAARIEKYELRNMRSRLHELRAVFLAAMGADEAQIEASLGEAIRIAKEQKSVLGERGGETKYAEYRRQKASGSGGRVIRLTLW